MVSEAVTETIPMGGNGLGLMGLIIRSVLAGSITDRRQYRSRLRRSQLEEACW